MFKLIAALFLALPGGPPSEQPVHIMTYNHAAFPSEEVCMSFINTDVGKAATGAIKLAAMGQGLFVKFACVEVEDNTI